MVRKKLLKNDMEMYIPPGSSLPQTAVTLTKAAKIHGIWLATLKGKNNKRKEREVYIGE